MKRYLVTGATGFVGGALVLELLRRTEGEIVCLVRASGSAEETRTRLFQSLAHAAVSQDDAEVAAEVPARCVPLIGDVCLPSCGVAAAEQLQIDEVWHAAASLKFKSGDTAEIFEHNVAGTRNVLQLARDLRAQVFNYISTAYVAGTRQGLILEELPATALVANNAYERSKIEAEWLLAETCPMHLRILRPSIVIGHSGTYAATSFTGLYGFVRELHGAKRRIAAALGDSQYPLRIRAEADGPINLVPVDVLAANAVGIATSTSSRCIFHLTTEAPPTVAECATVMFDALGMTRPFLLADTDGFSLIDHAFARATTFYASYLVGGKTFDQQNTAEAAGPLTRQWQFSPAALRNYVDWYIARLEAGHREIRHRLDTPAFDVAALRPTGT